MANLIYSILPVPRRAIVFVHPDVSLAQCVTMMVQDNIGALVVSDDVTILGILSERDIVRAMTKKDFSRREMKAADILSGKATVLKSSDTVEMAMEAITKTRHRHILVSEEGEIIALLSIGDLVFHLLKDQSLTIEHLQHYIQT
ncbi:MAG: CBS domain-containing protein [Legionellales bacterium]|nr:CBS domain-containing protein [Legionellales bacterium]